jgi:hypothetical protein
LASRRKIFIFFDAGKEIGILETSKPARCSGDGARGLQREFEVGGDVGDFHLAIADEGAGVRLPEQHLTQRTVGVIGEFSGDIFVPLGEAERTPD